MARAEQLNRDGYFIVRNALAVSEVEELRALLLDAARGGKGLARSKGVAFPDLFAPRFSALQKAASVPLGKAFVSEALHIAFNGSSYKFTGMADAQVNLSSPWHRDILHGRYRQTKFGAGASSSSSLFEWRASSGGERFRMFRLIFYLQDHSAEESEHALHVAAGSHLNAGCRKEAGTGAATQQCAKHGFSEIPSAGGNRGAPGSQHAGTLPLNLAPAMGDAILFDQLLVHRGYYKLHERARAMTRPRVVLQFSFGADNEFTRAWVAGDAKRRQEQLLKHAWEQRQNVERTTALTSRTNSQRRARERRTEG